MTDSSGEKRVVITSDAAALADSVAERFLTRVAKKSASRDVHVALTGGVSGAAVLRAAAAQAPRYPIDWTRVHFWWSDERFVRRFHPERNERQSREALLNALPDAHIHAAPASDEGLDLDEAAAAYAAELARYGTSDHPHWPTFDISFLGVGPDGHIASLFPDRPEILVTDASVVAVRDSPKPPSQRLTFTRPVINSSQRVWLVLSGADKASALGLALAGASYPSVPAAGAKGTRRTVFFVDQAAAAQVPPELIDQDY
ncbi:6-phosphogluconolactonase [Microbacterium sp. CCNWLW134]|uniref:6-phosphogluconolactonase n=1 Tax=Microbacterium sp. CCNWLW134 TaxID=3122064 RepID=UPI00300FFE59